MYIHINTYPQLLLHKIWVLSATPALSAPETQRMREALLQALSRGTVAPVHGAHLTEAPGKSSMVSPWFTMLMCKEEQKKMMVNDG